MVYRKEKLNDTVGMINLAEMKFIPFFPPMTILASILWTNTTSGKQMLIMADRASFTQRLLRRDMA